jgi:hypothetical protein
MALTSRCGGVEGIRTPDLLEWTSRSDASANLDPSLPNPPDLRLLPRIGPLPPLTLPDSLGVTRRTSDAISADFLVSHSVRSHAGSVAGSAQVRSRQALLELAVLDRVQGDPSGSPVESKGRRSGPRPPPSAPSKMPSRRAQPQRREGLSRGDRHPPTRAPGRPVGRVTKALHTAHYDAWLRPVLDAGASCVGGSVVFRRVAPRPIRGDPSDYLIAPWVTPDMTHRCANR